MQTKINRINFYRLDQFECKATLIEGHTRTIRNLSWSNDGRKLASCSFDSTICIWENMNNEQNEDDWKCNINLEGHENEVKMVAFSYDDKFLATCSRDKTVWIWENIGVDEYECASVLTDHSQDVKYVCWHPTKPFLASCSYDNSIKFYKEDGDDWSCFETLSNHESTVWSIDFNREGNKMVSSSDDQTIKIWHQLDDKWICVSTLSGFHRNAIYSVRWSKLNDCIATGGRDNSICIFKQNGEDDSNYALVVKIDNAHENDVNSVDWHPVDEKLLVSSSDDKSIRIWTFDEFA